MGVKNLKQIEKQATRIHENGIPVACFRINLDDVSVSCLWLDVGLILYSFCLSINKLIEINRLND